MHRRLDIIIALLLSILVVLMASLLTGCAAQNGLHSNNRVKNITTRWQIQQENQHRAGRL